MSSPARPCTLALVLPLLWSLVSGAPAAQAQQRPPLATVSLRASAEIEREAVTLGDVAEVTGTADAQVRKLRRLPLGQLAGKGVPVRLERAGIARWICVKRALCGAELAWSGAENVVVRLATRQVGSDGLVAVARAALERALAPLGAQVLIEEARGQDKVELPPGRLDYQARPLPAGLVPDRRMLVWVDVSADGSFVRAVPVRFEVSARVPAWVARVPVAAGARVTQAQFAPGEADLAQAGSAEVIRRGAEVAGMPAGAWVVRQSMREGQALTRKNSSPAPLVARGDIATLRMQELPIALETRVEVLQDGFLGQAVKVRAMQATGAIVATVAGPGLLEAKN